MLADAKAGEGRALLYLAARGRIEVAAVGALCDQRPQALHLVAPRLRRLLSDPPQANALIDVVLRRAQQAFRAVDRYARRLAPLV